MRNKSGLYRTIKKLSCIILSIALILANLYIYPGLSASGAETEYGDVVIETEADALSDSLPVEDEEQTDAPDIYEDTEQETEEGTSAVIESETEGETSAVTESETEEETPAATEPETEEEKDTVIESGTEEEIPAVIDDDEEYSIPSTFSMRTVPETEFTNLFPQYKNYNDEMTTISVDKDWTGDAEYSRPDTVTFDLYLDGQLLETLVLTADDDWNGSFVGSYPAYQIDEDGNYILDANGEKILLDYQVVERETANYKASYSTSRQHQVEDGSTIHMFVPATSIVPGEQYLAVSSNEAGQQSVYRAEATQTDGVLSSSILIGSDLVKDQDGNTYDNYILMKDLDGSYSSLLWNAYDAGNNSCYLFSNVYEMWGESHGLLSMTSTRKKLKIVKTAEQGTGTDTFTQAFYKVDDNDVGNAYKTASSTETIYLYKEVVPSNGVMNQWKTDVFVSNRYDPPISVDPDGETASEKTDMSVTKTWENDNEEDRPDSITVSLYANGKDTGKTLTLSAENGWKGSFTDLDAYQDGKLISYSVKEEVPEGYSVQYDYDNTEQGSSGSSAKGYWVRTNQLVDGETYLIVTSPSSGTVTGMEIEEEGKGFAWTSGSGAGTINVGGPITINGQTYATHITQEEAAAHTRMQWTAHYDSASTSPQTGYHKWFLLESVSNPGCYPKFNGSGDISDGSAHESLLYYGLQYKVDDKGKYVALDEQGNEQITPTVENYPDDFNYVLGNHDHYFLLTNNGTGDAGAVTAQTFYLYKFVEVTGPSVTITNTRSEETSLDVYKNWNDDNNSAGKRPDSIEVQLLANGAETNQTAVLSAQNDWKYIFEDLPVYDEEGKEIQYSVKEINPPEGYTGSVLTGTVSSSEEVTEYSWAWVLTTTLEAGKTYILADGNSGTCATIGVSDGKSTLSGTSVTVHTDATLTGENGNHYSAYILDEDAANVTKWNTQASGSYVVLENGGKYFAKGKGNLESSIEKALLLQYDAGNFALKDSKDKYMADNGDFNKDKKEVSTYLYERVKIANTKTVDTVRNVATVTNTYQEPTGEFLLQKEDGNTGKPLSGAFAFSLKTEDGTDVVGYQNIWVDENGQILFSNLPYGSYCLEETKTPDGYAKLSSEIRFNLSADGITLTNTDDLHSSVSIKNEQGIQVICIKNYRWISMPETGFMSRRLMREIGFGLLLAGMLFLIYNQKKEKE